MDINQIIIIAIIILVAIIVVILGYYFINKLIEKKSEGKSTLINPNKLHEENSLMNMMDDKKNMEYQTEDNKTNTYINKDEKIEVAETSMVKEEKPINPFGVDLTKKVDNMPNYSENNDNKFFN